MLSGLLRSQKQEPVLAGYFSDDYFVARSRFRQAATVAGMDLFEYPINAKGPEGQTLTIDVARLGPKKCSRVLVLSSGLHGVEGFLGSAIQLAFLKRLVAMRPTPGTAIVVIHALNPYGFAWIRRVNEDNADLNRNFLLEGESYSGRPAGYDDIHDVINTQAPPRRLSLFIPRGLLRIARHGMAPLKQSFSGGQYDYPKGISFGGHGPSQTMTILRDNIETWVGGAERAVHLDFHSGLGAKASYKLFVEPERGEPEYHRLENVFGEDFVEPWGDGKLSYKIQGGLGRWCQSVFGRNYDVLCAEFGTVPALLVGEALHLENRAHHYDDPTSSGYQAAKQKLLEAFCPGDSDWKELVVARGIALCDQALAGLE